MPSEQLHGISRQPKNTCPMIDEAISDIKKAERALRRWEDMETTDELSDACETAESHIASLESQLEDIRSNAADIRSWGQEWKDLAKAKIEEVESLEERIKELEQQLREATTHVS